MWNEVRALYPDRFVKLKILKSHTVNNNKYIDEVAVVKAFADNKEATRELVRCEDDTIVYHTANEAIVLEMRNVKGYRGICV